MRRLVGAAIATTAVVLLACDVTSGDSLNTCTETIPAACGQVAHCVLASSQYLHGTFPGSQIFVIRTQTPERVTFSFDLSDRISAGTTLTLTSTEPDCSGQSSYTNMGDIFELAGASGILSFPITMTEAGDHLIQFSSDSYCSYDLVYQ